MLSAYLGGDPRKGLWPPAYAGAEPTPKALREQVQVLYRLPVVGGLPRASDAAGISLVEVARAGAHLVPHVLADAGRVPGPGVEVLAQCERMVVVVVRDPVGILAGEQALQALGPSLRRRVALLVTGSTARDEFAEAGETPSHVHRIRKGRGARPRPLPQPRGRRRRATVSASCPRPVCSA